MGRHAYDDTGSPSFLQGMDCTRRIIAATKPMFEDILLSSESSDEESDDEDILSQISNVPYIISAIMLLPENHPKQSDYLELIGKYSDHDFWRHFRVTRSSFELLLSFMKSKDLRSSVCYHGGFDPMTIEEMIYITLQYLGNQGALRLLADKFERTESSIWKAVDSVCSCLFDNQSEFIKWPKSGELDKVAADFKSRAGFPGTIGSVDGTHVRIHAPSADQKSYLNYKQFHSVVLMAIALPDKTFSAIFTGFPGSNHDSYVFQRSSLNITLQSSPNALFDSGKYHIVGDSAFPLETWMLTPFKKNAMGLSPSEKRYNYKHSATRTVVEQTFGDLFNRFRRCNDIQASIEKVVKIITASCVIHNACVQNGDFCQEKDSNIVPHTQTNPIPRSVLTNRPTNAVEKRDRIRAIIFRR